MNKKAPTKMPSILLLMSIIVAICKCEEFSISSTSTPPTECQKFANILTKLHEKIELQSIIISNQITGQMEKLEQRQISERTNFSKITNTEDTDERIKKLEVQVAELKNLERTRSIEPPEQQFAKLKNAEEISSLKPPKTNTIPEDCLEVKERGNNASGVYLIKPKFAPSPFLVVCDMATRGGGWTLILNRFDGSVNFYLPWQSYKDGFGNLAGEFWLGLENIHQLSGYKVNELLVELVGSDKSEAYAHYKQFSVGGETEGYPLQTLGGFTGTAENSLLYHAGLKFTTKDKDQDTYSGNCAELYSGAWWYGECHQSQLTGVYKEASDKYKGMRWGDRYFQKKARMLLRPQHDPTLIL